MNFFNNNIYDRKVSYILNNIASNIRQFIDIIYITDASDTQIDRIVHNSSYRDVIHKLSTPDQDVIPKKMCLATGFYFGNSVRGNIFLHPRTWLHYICV